MEDEQTTIDVGDVAPTFTLPDAGGTPRALADALAHGPLVVSFFKADCAACQLAFPYLDRLDAQYRPAGLAVWGVSQHPARAAEWFAKTTGVGLLLLIDADDLTVSIAYDPPATPTTYLIDQSGRVVFRAIGFTKRETNELSATVATLLDVEPVEVAPADDGKPALRPG